ncbi:unnamed protein product [Rotaria sordida]|uniref:Phytanoyl-CoA dioxygenase n=1 Tax=Rotaria sordida TaxID=392033 RepID=A0A815TV54_9BILA|nr:unnamed protein product [Rotaria sordida]
MSKLNELVTSEHLKQFDRHGYFILSSVIPVEHLTIMNNAIDRAIKKRDEKMHQMINSNNTTPEDDGLILCSTDGNKYMEQIVRAVLGENVYYTHSEIVVKRGQGKNDSSKRTAFAWHQDSGYVPYEHTPYLSCWCALTEMTSNNGTISVLPAERNPSADENHKIRWFGKARPSSETKFPSYAHRPDDSSPDLLGYFGNDPGVEVVCPAGSIVVFSSLTLHCSSPNRSDSLRSAYNVQYAPVPLMSEDQKSFRHKADPFIIQSKTDEELKKWQL